MSVPSAALFSTELRQVRSFWRRFRHRPTAALGLIMFTVFAVMALCADMVAPGDPLAASGALLSAPFEVDAFPLGTDLQGRDLLAGLFHGARTSLAVGALATFVGLSIGVLVGLLSGLSGGWVDAVLERLIEAIRFAPDFMLLLAMVAVFGHSVQTIALAVGFISWTETAHRVRARTIALRESEFVEAVRNLGASKATLLIEEILPNVLPPVIVSAPMLMAVAILLESALAFLGLGDPDHVSWGAMLGASRVSLHEAWFVALIPGMAIMITAVSLTLIGDGLKMALGRGQGKA